MSAAAPAAAPAMETPPRPLSTFALVGISGAALAVTGQLSAFAILLHAAALVAALGLRARPRAWQRNEWLLNLGLVGCCLFGVASWLRGELALLALAHFAHLAQALQLLDARPRRSDFLIVALALFQMILAANLTDSLLFPPLLVAFLFAVVWTLLVHTLWMEAVESGEPLVSRRGPSRGLLRTTLFASALSILLAGVIFLMLPRVRSGALVSGGALGAPAAGFSDRVALGDLGRIRKDEAVVLRVETLSGVSPAPEHAYWRGLAFDRFDGLTWSITPPGRDGLHGAPELGIDLAGTERADFVQRILREPVASGVLFGAGLPVRLVGSVGRLQRDRNGGLYAPGSLEDRVQYVLAVRAPLLARSELDQERAAIPRLDGERYLVLPDLSPAVSALAERITHGLTTDIDRVLALEQHLRETGHYTDDPPSFEGAGGAATSPVEQFLLADTEGHCEYFASGMVVLARSIGIPARLVNGFAGGRENAIGDFVELSRSDAHAWVEVHFEEAGWVRFDPTPPDLRMRVGGTDWWVQASDLGSALEHWWYQNVVEFDRSDQMGALRAGWLAWQRWRSDRVSSAARSADQSPATADRRLPTPVLEPAAWVLLASGLAVAGAWLFLRAQRQAHGLPPSYATALRLIERHRGLVRPATKPARDFAREASATLPPAAAAAFWQITEAYLAERFGDRPMPSERRPLRTLRDSLRA